MRDKITTVSDDIFERILISSKWEFSYYLQYPNKYKFLRRSFTNDGSEIYDKTETKYKHIADNMYNMQVLGIDEDILKWDPKSVFDIIKWVIKGFNEDFTNQVCIDTDIETTRSLYVDKLEKYLKILKTSMYK